jgi:hypothetical protein
MTDDELERLHRLMDHQFRSVRVYEVPPDFLRKIRKDRKLFELEGAPSVAPSEYIKC